MPMLVVNACVIGLFAGAIATTAGVPAGTAVTVGIVAVAALVGISVAYAGAAFRLTWRRYIPRRPTTTPPSHLA